MSIPLGERVGIAELKGYSGFGTGWTHPEHYGIWTEGSRSELRIGVGETRDDDFVVTLMIGMVCAGPEKPLRVMVLVGEEEVATREFAHTDVAFAWRVELPVRTRAGREIDLVVVVDEPRSPLELGWSTDERRLGVLLEALTLEQIDRFVAVGEEVLFCEGSGAERLLDDGWSTADPTGVWTAEEEARLIVRLADSAPTGMELVLDGLAFVTNEHPRPQPSVRLG